MCVRAGADCFLGPFILFSLPETCVLHLLTLNGSADVCFLAGDSQGLADRQQHRHHERRLEGLLVRPHCRKSVLVQRR